jgi:hypothetical protein
MSLMIGASTLADATTAIGGEATNRADGLIDVKRDYGAIGDGTADDTGPLQKAIFEGATRQIPVRVPPGVYATTRPLQLPPNAQLQGSAASANFGCRIEPHGCPAFQLGRDAPSFHVLLENILIWPQGSAASHILEIGNSYSCTFRNIRIHNAQSGVKAAVLLRAADERSGVEPCNSITWHNLIVRNDTEQPLTAIQASPRCGTHRFYGVDLENYQVLLDWQGGQLDLIAPYMERAGRHAVQCNVAADDNAPASLHTFGGTVSVADSAVALGVRERFGMFSSYGTLWGFRSHMAAYFYTVPRIPFTFHDTCPNLAPRGVARFGGVEGWSSGVGFPDCAIKVRVPITMSLEPKEYRSIPVPVPGVIEGIFSAHVSVIGNANGAIASAHVSADNVVTLGFVNPTPAPLQLNSLVAAVECRAA